MYLGMPTPNVIKDGFNLETALPLALFAGEQ